MPASRPGAVPTSVLAAINNLIARTAAARTDRGIMLYGSARPALAASLERLFQDAAWVTVALEGSDQTAHANEVAPALAATAGALLEAHHPALEEVLSVLRARTEFAAGPPGWLPEYLIEDLLAAAAPGLAAKGVGLAVLVENIDALDDVSLAALLSLQHKAAQRSWPFYVIGSGGPGLPARLGDMRGYADRLFLYSRVGE